MAVGDKTYKTTGFDIYFKEGMTPKFQKQFKKLVAYVFYKKKVVIDFDEFYSFCNDKLRKRLEEDKVFDPQKCNSFATYLHNIISFEAQRVNSKYFRLVSYDCLENKYFIINSNLDLFSFYLKLKSLKIDFIDYNKLKINLEGKIVTPLIFAYLWLKLNNKL